MIIHVFCILEYNSETTNSPVFQGFYCYFVIYLAEYNVQGIWHDINILVMTDVCYSLPCILGKTLMFRDMFCRPSHFNTSFKPYLQGTEFLPELFP